MFLKGENMQKNEVNEVLNQTILDEIEKLQTAVTGSDAQGVALVNVKDLYHLKIEEEKTLLEIEVKQRQMEKDDEFRQQQLKEQVKDRYFRVGVETAGIVLPLVFYASWMKRGLKFEETGIFTSQTFKGLINKFKPTRR